MNKKNAEELIIKLHNVVEYCRKYYIRILIELDPNYDNIYIHTDIWSQFYVQRELAKNNIDPDQNIKFTITNEKIYYPKEQDMTVLQEKRETIKRFYNSKIDVICINMKEAKLILVPIHQEFDKKITKKLKEIFMFNSIENIRKKFKEIDLTAEYKRNIAYNNRFIVFRY